MMNLDKSWHAISMKCLVYNVPYIMHESYEMICMT